MLQAKQSSRRVESESSAANAPIFLCDLTGAEQPFGEGSVVQLRTQLEPADDVRMQLHWYKDGHELRDSARIKRTNEFGQIGLDISPCWPSDAGVYTCRAENDAGEAIVSTVITCLAQQSVVFDSQLPAEMRQQSIERIARIEQLQQAKLREAIDQEQKRLARQPRFLCPPPAELQVPEGHTARLQCRVQPPDEPSTQVIWLHDQRQLVSSSRVRTTFEFGTCSLEITRLDQRDAGQYTCLVRSEFGECSASTRITCLADTKPTHPDRSLLQDAEKLAKPSPAKPSASSVAPKFLRQLPAQTRVAEGESVCFETQVTPTDDPQLQVHWFKDGQPLRLGSRVHTLHQFGHVRLELTWTITEDAGVYTCKAINAAGSDETIAAVDITRKPSVIMEQQLPANVSLDNLRKLENRAPPELEVPVKSLQPPQFITQMMPLNDLKEGDAAHFECRLVPTDDPKLEVNWYFNGQPLTSGHRYRTMHDFGIVSLDILDVYAEDSGEYTCRAVNQAGQDLTSVSLHCRPKPSLIYQTQLPNKTMEMGIQRLAELESSRTTSTTTTLTPGENRDGAAPDSDQDSRPKLSAPEFVTEPEAQEVIEGEYTRFSARITGHPRPRIFWVINGETVINGSKYKLTYDGIYHLDIPRARQSDNGKVEVFAKNAAGECYACTSLIVRPKHDDYRAVLKNSPRPWYDYKISKYQRERREQELGKVFDEKLTPGGTEIARWKTQQTEEEKRVKVQEHVLHDTAASGSVVMPSNKLMEPVDNDQQTLDRSTVVGKREKTFIERSRETLDRSLPKVAAQSETNLEGKQVSRLESQIVMFRFRNV